MRIQQNAFKRLTNSALIANQGGLMKIGPSHYNRNEDSLIINSEGKTILSCKKSPDAFT